MKPRAGAVEAWLALNKALEACGGVPCRERERNRLWISEERADREQAVARCADCPVLALCRTAGRFERFGVWGGIDRSPRPKGRPPAGRVPDWEVSCECA